MLTGAVTTAVALFLELAAEGAGCEARGSSSSPSGMAVLDRKSAASEWGHREGAGLLCLMCTRRCVGARAEGWAASSSARRSKLLLLWLVDMRDVALPSLASEARENESRDCALAALLESNAMA